VRKGGIVSDSQDSINYPDLLGAVTGGSRLNLDVVQGALAVRPSQVPAGRFFEIILLLQNASDIDVDVVAEPVLPVQDKRGKKGLFLTKSTRLLIGLRPAEVGFAALPVSTSPNTAPGPGYPVGVNVTIKHVGKQRPQRVRATDGGGSFMVQGLSEETQGHLEALRMLPFYADTGGKKNHFQAFFEVLPPAVSSLKELKPDWISLWTMRDYMDEYVLAQKVWPQAQGVLQQLKRNTVFMPLLKATQARFQACGYALFPPEAIFITKLMTLILETGAVQPIPEDPHPEWPHWFIKLCRLLFQEPALATQIELLITRLLYGDLCYDTSMYGFTMLSTVANEEFGTLEEISHYSDDIVNALAEGKPLDFSRTYLPMVLGGLIANARVTMPNEQIRETVFILSKAMDNRRHEKTEENKFIFELAEQLIERALDAM
jgi:hypothetical protein